MKECGLGQLKIDEFVSNYMFSEQLITRLQVPVRAGTRIYCLEGFNFAKRDVFSESDPFLVLKCGKKTHNDEENYQLDTNEPKFYKHFDFLVEFPGAPVVEIWAYDYDLFFGNDLIGVTKFDLDDRFFSKEWCSIQNKPIEYRNLYVPTSTISQGVIKLWVEIADVKNPLFASKAIDITPEPPVEFEGRFIVWKTDEVEMMDWEGTSDVFCRVFLDPDDDHNTDTHWRNQDGKASFNWRIKFKINHKRGDKHNLTL